ncbi:DNA alkylation repair protein [Pseudarthrobacter sp. 1G09]|uniref:DNA alkylation repair protein n=1 Tax=Pseudarthrobacter sp. 1G09 TaxID=3416178 RepID=UPI003CE7C7A7
MDELINSTVIDNLSSIMGSHAGIDTSALRSASNELAGLKLRARVDLIRAALLNVLPTSYRDTDAMSNAMFEDPRLDGWMIWPLSEAIVHRALNDASTIAFDDAHRMLAKLTTRLTGEFAIRDLLIADPRRSLGIAAEWTESPDEHVRRLASEGTRPRLPWAKRVPALIGMPGVTSPIIDRLPNDPSAYVRRSVGNHLNDISRDHPNVASAIAAGWAEQQGLTPTVRRGLRTLVKQGNTDALKLLGYSNTPLGLAAPTLDTKRVRIGETLTFTLTVQNLSDHDAHVVVDFVLLSPTAKGGQSEKVFKLATRLITAKHAATVSGKRSFATLSTRTIRPGQHSLMTQANGQRSAQSSFEVTA